MKVGIFCPNIRPVCGRSKAILLLAKGLNKHCIHVYLFTNKESDFSLINQYGIKLKVIPINPLSKSIYNFNKSILLIKKYATYYELDVVHTHHRYVEFLAFITKKVFGLNYKSVTTVHSLVTDRRFISFKSDKVIAVSNFIKENLIKNYNLQKNRISVIPTGIEIPSELSELKSNEIVLLGFGRFEHEKGFDIILKAVENLKPIVGRIVVKLVGEGSQGKYYHNLSKILNIDVEININYGTPWDEIKKATIVVVPSRIEAFGLSILEAGAMGKCVVASNVGGIPEIIDNEINGLLFERESEEDLFYKLKYLLDNRSLIEEYGKKLKTKVEEYFILGRMIDLYLKEYQKLLAYKSL